MSYRTDLAVESLEVAAREGVRADTEHGVRQETRDIEGYRVTCVHIESDEGARDW